MQLYTLNKSHREENDIISLYFVICLTSFIAFSSRQSRTNQKYEFKVKPMFDRIILMEKMPNLVFQFIPLLYRIRATEGIFFKHSMQ